MPAGGRRGQPPAPLRLLRTANTADPGSRGARWPPQPLRKSAETRRFQEKWLKVGDFAALPLNRAQVLARGYRSQVDAGVDPGAALREAGTAGETVAGLAEKYRAEVLPRLGASTQQSYGSALDLYILPKLGRFAVRELTTNQVQLWHDEIPFRIAANRALATLSAMMTLAVEVWGMRPDSLNPCTRVERNPEPPRARAGVEDLNIHDFRSLAASEAEAQGLGPKTGAAILGHADIRTTLKHYTRARKTREAAAKVAAPIARALSGKATSRKKPRK